MKNILFYFCVILDLIVLFYIIFFFNKKEMIYVEIKGAVKNPGVYELEENSIVRDAIELSGGLIKEADISITNLAKKVNDGMVIIIYTKDEINESRKNPSVVKYIDKECICPIIKNDICITEVITNSEGNIVNTGKVSLNSATKEELMTLPGIGESKAINIIEYRDTHNGFNSIEEITNVKGVGKSIYEKIKDYLIL